MTIALTAVIRPSCGLRVALLLYGLASAAAALGLLCWQSARFHAPQALALACFIAAVAACVSAARPANPRQIDISGLGEIRLSVQQSLGPEALHNDALVLLPGSTVWPSLLMLLLLDRRTGAVSVATILPDSVSRDQFRKLAVAVTWIARRDNKFVENNKIL